MSVQHPDGAPSASGETRSLGAIVSDITNDLSQLMRQELDLAKTELKQEVTKVGTGAGMLAGAGVAALLVLVFLSLALTWWLDDVMPVELAALIVGLLWAVIAAVLALVGRKQIKNAEPQLPQTQQTIQDDVQWAKEQGR